MDPSQPLAVPTHSATDFRAVAPVWHTIVLLIVLMGFSALGLIFADRVVAHHPRTHVIQYVATIIFEWLLAAFVWFGVRRRGVKISQVVGGRWSSFVDVLRDIGIGIGFLIVAGIVLQLLGHLLKAAPTRALKSILPSGTAEMILWVVMSVSAGFCEELVFRGYFQRQFAALPRSAAGGILLQGIFFGAAHGYQGWRLMIVIAVFGIMFGLLAQWRRSTRPGMFAHALQDTLGGLLGRHLMR